ncbi:hypothetical protein QT397_18100 [Microbulbifer sp. MKSA007]|nr:hypothetical protein QT397_18100 [Microbulbifer sp. MKSA007]
MNLIEARNDFIDVLEVADERPEPIIASYAKVWWREFKKWESKDTVSKAFHESRLSIRVYNNCDGSDSSSKWQTIYESTMATPFGESGKKSYDHIYDVSGQGVLARTMPSFFYNGPGSQSLKYRYGLHDLSASLLTREKPISEQLFLALDRGKHGAVAVFMPLPEPEDMHLLHVVDHIVKKYPESSLCPLFREYRSKMTRIKLAYENDIGAQMIAFDRPSSSHKPGVKLKYGLGNRIKEKGLIGTRPVTPEDREQLAENAFHYKDILTSEKRAKYNEITIAYRQHGDGSTSFPKFGVWNAPVKSFGVFDINSGQYTGEEILDYPPRLQ